MNSLGVCDIPFDPREVEEIIGRYVNAIALAYEQLQREGLIQEFRTHTQDEHGKRSGKRWTFVPTEYGYLLLAAALGLPANIYFGNLVTYRRFTECGLMSIRRFSL